MKKSILLILLTITAISCAKAQQTVQPATGEPVTEITFNYTRLSGVASNQFAVWIEDAQGNFVKTVYATKWTATGGWKRRPASIPMWVKKSNVVELSDAQIDAVSGATPRTGSFTCVWDGTNVGGAVVPNGDYVIVLEGTLRWENQVYYRAPISPGKGAATPAVSVEYVGDADKDRAMIENVIVKVLR